MNLQILSNTVMEGRVNKTNEFEMKLLHPIDGLNNPAFIEDLEVSYPSTTNNVGAQDCWVILQIFYDDFKKLGDKYEKCKLHFLSKDFFVPEGIYDLKKLINFLNNMLEEYDIFFFKDNDGKIRISVNMYIEYWEKKNQENFHLSSKSCENLKKNLKLVYYLNFHQNLLLC